MLYGIYFYSHTHVSCYSTLEYQIRAHVYVLLQNTVKRIHYANHLLLTSYFKIIHHLLLIVF